ncbi:hypothetical protein BGZ65_006064 [Modicella reniformis]|uniref:Arm-like repeat domain-containing protein n=1 Tax=Modicella reniformis TaxID=1440133 RepID=A0A9P6MBF3_9FUNG|nr:hypothetical protein BGZ65_006064 [Modicella reniformis]
MLDTSSSEYGDLSPQKALKLAISHLENARRTPDCELALMLYNEAETALSRMGQSTLGALLSSDENQDQSLREGIAYVVLELDKMSISLGSQDKTQASYKKAQALRTLLIVPDGSAKVTHSDPSSLPLQDKNREESDMATTPSYIFTNNITPPAIAFKLPESDERIKDTAQLAYCLKLLKVWSSSPDDIQEPTVLDWLHAIEKDEDERERLKTLATDVIKAFTRTELKNSNDIAEVVCLVSVLEKDDFHHLLEQFYNDIDRSILLDSHQLEGIAQLIQSAGPDYLTATDLVKILEQLKDHLRDIHKQSPPRVYQLTQMVSNVLDAMADSRIKGLDRKQLHELLSAYLDGLKGTSDAFLVYQATYAYQSMQYILDDKSLWQTALQSPGCSTHGQQITTNVAHVVELDRFLEGLHDIQQRLTEVPVVSLSTSFMHKGVTSMNERAQGFLDCLNESLSFECKQAWYPALRMTDILLQSGQFADFRKLVNEASCRLHPAFQWGLCQRLGNFAVNSKWDAGTRQSAVAFLGEIHHIDTNLEQQATTKQWIVNILTQLMTLSEDIKQGELE